MYQGDVGHVGPDPHIRGEQHLNARSLIRKEERELFISGPFCRGQYLFLAQAGLYLLGQPLPGTTSGQDKAFSLKIFS